MVNAPFFVSDCPPGLVTRTFQLPSSPPLRLKVQPIEVEEETDTPVAVIDGYPALVNFTVAPLSKFVPVMVAPTSAAFAPLAGDIEETAGVLPEAVVTTVGGIVGVIIGMDETVT